MNETFLHLTFINKVYLTLKKLFLFHIYIIYRYKIELKSHFYKKYIYILRTGPIGLNLRLLHSSELIINISN